MRALFLATLIAFSTAAVIDTAQAKSKAACTKIVKSKEKYLTAGGRCGEECRTAISMCVRGKRI